MAPNARFPLDSNYSQVEDWKDDLQVKANPISDAVGETPCKSARSSNRSIDNDENRRQSLDPLPQPRRNCCRTNNEIPCGSHFPIEDTLDSVHKWKPAAKQVKHMEYGYQATWRPGRTVVPIKDIMETCVATPADTRFRSSIKVINSGTGAWSEKWKASKRYIDPGRSNDFEWRPSIKTSHPHKGGHEEAYRPQVRPDPAHPSLETKEGQFKPKRRHVLAYTPLKADLPYQQKRHIHVQNEWVPPFKLQGEDYNKSPPRQRGKGMAHAYSNSHPHFSLAWDVLIRPGSAPATNYLSGLPHNTKRYIASGHSSNFELKSCCICKDEVGALDRRALRNRSASLAGPYHDTVSDRNPISGDVPQTEIFHPRQVPCGPALYGPAGTINSDIIDHKFSDLVQKVTPLSEMKDRYRHWEVCKS